MRTLDPFLSFLKVSLRKVKMKPHKDYWKGSYDILYKISKLKFSKRLDICIAILFLPKLYRKYCLSNIKKEIEKQSENSQDVI